MEGVLGYCIVLEFFFSQSFFFFCRMHLFCNVNMQFFVFYIWYKFGEFRDESSNRSDDLCVMGFEGYSKLIRINFGITKGRISNEKFVPKRKHWHLRHAMTMSCETKAHPQRWDNFGNRRSAVNALPYLTLPAPVHWSRMSECLK